LKRLISVPFAGLQFFVIDFHGEAWASVDLLSDALSLDREKTHLATQNELNFGSTMIRMPGVDVLIDLLCIPVRKLYGWLIRFSKSNILSGLDDALHRSWLSIKEPRLPLDGRVVLTLSAGQVKLAQHIPDDWLIAPLDGFHEIASRAGFVITHQNIHKLLYANKI